MSVKTDNSFKNYLTKLGKVDKYWYWCDILLWLRVKNILKISVTAFLFYLYFDLCYEGLHPLVPLFTFTLHQYWKILLFVFQKHNRGNIFTHRILAMAQRFRPGLHLAYTHRRKVE